MALTYKAKFSETFDNNSITIQQAYPSVTYSSCFKFSIETTYFPMGLLNTLKHPYKISPTDLN